MGLEVAEMNQIESFRKKKGLTQAQLASAIGYSENTIWRWENAQRVPNAEALKILARVLGCTIDELVSLDPHSAPTG